MPRSIAEVRAATQAGSESAEIHVQIEELRKKEGSNGKPFWEMKMRDASDALTLRVWTDTPNFRICETLANGDCIGIQGEFYQNGAYGMDSKRWEIRKLQAGERDALFEGPAAVRAAIDADYQFLVTTVDGISDPRLKALATRFFEIHGVRFKRAAAARLHHHARRGGLVNHTAQMMRSGLAIAQAYPQLNADLLASGILFHDVGKLWETCPPEEGFSIGHDVHGELMGHISIGVEIVNALWRDIPKDAWQDVTVLGVGPPAPDPPHPLASRRTRIRLPHHPENPRGARAPFHRQPRRPPGNDLQRLRDITGDRSGNS